MNTQISNEVKEKIKASLSTLKEQGIFEGSILNYVNMKGANLVERHRNFDEWLSKKINAGYWLFFNSIESAPAPTMKVTNNLGVEKEGINYSSQDYLSMCSNPRITEAAKRALDIYGPHSAGSPALQGNTKITLQLEKALGEALEMDYVALFPTGWGAGFGAITALVRKYDHIVTDSLAHNCLMQGSKAATNNIYSIPHLSLETTEQKLKQIRETDTKNGILVITEGLFSMDSDAPDIPKMQALCNEYNATLLVDVAHDFGSMGENGGGSLERQNMLGKVDIVMGSFSKTFASNGGFVASNDPAIKQYMRYYGYPLIFSNSLSPVQASVVHEALTIIRSEEGKVLRQKLATNIRRLREALNDYDIHCIGEDSPIVPAFIGSDVLARIASYIVFERGLFANLVEFPAVARHKARFRMQVMANHTPEHATQAAHIVAESLKDAQEILEEFNILSAKN